MTAWRRSSRCDASTCVEVAHEGGEVLVRDSKDANGPVLRFDLAEWERFRVGVLEGDFAFDVD